MGNGHDGPRSGRAGRRAVTLLGNQRYRVLWALPVAALGVFSLFRAGLLIASRGYLDGAGAGEIARCFLVGMRYDTVAVGYAMIPVVLVAALAPNPAFQRAWFRRGVTIYAAAVVTLTLVVEIVGAYFLLHFGNRLNWLALEYWGHFDEVAAYIRQRYPVWVLPVAAVAGFAGSYLLFRRICWGGARPTGPVWRRPIAATVLTGLCVLAARGSLDHHRLRFGAAYFSTNRAICQLALNNFFTLGEGCKSYVSDQLAVVGGEGYPAMETAWEVARDMLAQPGDTFLDVEKNPLWRRTTSPRPRRDYNVVIIVMEGMSGLPVGALGHRPSHTPCLDALAKKGLFAERLYGVGDRTCRGLIGMLCGHPDLAGKSVMKRSRAMGRFLALPGILARRGYRTLFLFGGNPDFDNMKGFFGAAGIQRFVTEDDMNPEDAAGIWGTHDAGMFRKAHEVFLGLGDRKFFAVIKTLSNHEPFDVPAAGAQLLPTDHPQHKRLNAYRYADWAIGEFFRLAPKAPYFRRTIFVLAADQERTVNRRRILDVEGYRLPCLIYAPGIVPAGRIEAVASQADIPPTVLGLLGGTYEHCFLGRDLLAVEASGGFAFLRNDNRLGLVWTDRALVLTPGHKTILFRTQGHGLEQIPPDRVDAAEVEKARLRMLSYYLVAQQLYLDNAYDFPSEPGGRSAGGAAGPSAVGPVQAGPP